MTARLIRFAGPTGSGLRCAAALVAVALLGFGGCGGSDSTTARHRVSEADFAGLSVEWSPCSLEPGADDGLAECAEVVMPLRWEFPEDPGTFRTAAKRLLSGGPVVEGQLWLLARGPGDSGTLTLPPAMQGLRDANLGFDVYTLDARGTGGSEFLGCPDQEAESSDLGPQISSDELEACIAYLETTYGDRLDVYGTTHAAIDLAALIHHTREEGKKVLIWGGSGGTFWAQRYLQFFPDQADGVIMEGIVAPDWSVVFHDEYFELITRELLADCLADEFCSSKLPDPEATLLGLLDKLDQGHCPQMPFTSDLLLGLISDLNYFHPTKQFVPALIYRLDRCSFADVSAIFRFADFLYPEPEPAEYSTSSVLFFNEVFSELWEHDSFRNNLDLLDYLDGVYEDILFGYGLGYLRNDYYRQWPRYSDPHDDTWAQSDVPMLLLQGQIDPATPHDFALDVAEHFDGPFQHWASFPDSAHNVTFGSPLADGPEAMHCGLELVIAFMQDPTGELDLSCI
ncbi:MAG: alpha/beta hydrolase, partial [Myxococcota bacterium]